MRLDAQVQGGVASLTICPNHDSICFISYVVVSQALYLFKQL